MQQAGHKPTSDADKAIIRVSAGGGGAGLLSANRRRLS